MSNIISISDVRANLPDLVTKVNENLERIVITVNGQPKATIISSEELESLEETVELLQTKGFSQKQSEDLARIYSTNEDYWVNFMMQHELELPNPSKENPVFTALATFFSFLAFGSIPLLPYLFLTDSSKSFLYATIAAASALLLLGLLRWKISKENLIRSVSEILLVGGLAAGVAYLVGTFFTIH